jgi:hypothetical protein
MNWKALKEQAELYIGGAAKYPKRWFNEAKSLLSTDHLTACRTASTTISVTDVLQSYSLPSETRCVKEVRDSDGMKVVYYSADIQEGVIRFPQLGDFTVKCAYATDDFAGSDLDIPQIHSAYHYPIAKYIASKELEYPRPEQSAKLMAEFYSEANSANKSLSKGRAGRFILPVRR